MRDTTIRLASYNIRKARGLDQKRNPHRTLEVINRLNADVVVLQEADRRLGPRHPAIPPDMVAAETDFHVVNVANNGISLGAHGNAVLVRDLDLVGEVTALDLPGLEPRGAVSVDLKIGAGLRVIAAHLGLRRRDRLKQLAVLRAQTDGAANAVIAGDFNEWSAEKGFTPLEADFTLHAPGRTFHARRPLAALDRFALSHQVALQDAGVLQDKQAKVASDHLPIWADLEMLFAEQHRHTRIAEQGVGGGANDEIIRL